MTSEAKVIGEIKSLGEELTKSLSSSDEDDSIDSTRCFEILKSLENLSSNSKPYEIGLPSMNTSSGAKKKKDDHMFVMTIAILNETKIGLCLNKMGKTLRRLKRATDKEDSNNVWKECIDLTQKLLSKWKDDVKKEREGKTVPTTSIKSATSSEAKNDTGTTSASVCAAIGNLPTTVSEYRSRLISQKKELYKDPPALPPCSINIETEYCPLPKRDPKSGLFTFTLSKDQQASKSKLLEYIKDFKPNRSPEEVLRAGSFGGTYFRPIVSSVTNVRYSPSAVLKDTVKPEWISNIDKKAMLTASTYNAKVNKFKVKCGGSLGMWESSGWISDSDPYGWFQWYCRFYQGRRCDDDERQISRWLKSAGPKGRFRSQLCNKIIAQGGLAKVEDFKISPVIRQTLLHWGLEITEDILRKHGKRVGSKL